LQAEDLNEAVHHEWDDLSQGYLSAQQQSEGGNPFIVDATGNDQAEVAQVRGDVHGEPMHANPVADLDAHSSHFLLADPYSCQPLFTVSRDTQTLQSPYQSLFESSQVKMHVSTVLANV